MTNFHYAPKLQVILMLVTQDGGKNDITNHQGQELDSITLSAGYNLITDKPTHVINTSMSCIGLIFCTNQISNHEVDVPIFDKCHHDIIYGNINIRVSLPPTYV